MTLDEVIRAEMAEWSRLTARRTKQPSDCDAHRLIIIGGLVADEFPQVLNFKPQPTEIENHMEFAPIKEALALLKADREYLDRLLTRAQLRVDSVFQKEVPKNGTVLPMSNKSKS